MDAFFLASNVIPKVLSDVTILLGLAIIVLLASNYFRIPAILGLLITGVLAGPEALKLVSNTKNLNLFAEIGVILLLFSIGIEFSLKSLYKIRKQVFLGGALQMGLTMVGTMVGSYLFGLSTKTALILGFLFSLSSTAIVLKLLQTESKLNTAQGKASMAILIFQDIAVVPLMLIIPYFSDQNDQGVGHLVLTLLKGVVTVIVALVAARVIMPKLLFAVAKSKSTELFLLTVIVICLAVAGLTALMGLSLSLGAFLAGLIISESEYSHEAFGTILPFRELFTSFFFISIGLLVDFSFFINNPISIIGLTLMVMFFKLLFTSVASFATGNNLRIALIAGIFLCQVGEFSFILSGEAMKYQLLTNEQYQLFLSVSILSMALTPNLVSNGERMAGRIGQYFISENMRLKFPALVRSAREKSHALKKLTDHVVLIGFGDSGKNIAKVLRMAQIPYVAVDSDPEIVLAAKTKRLPVIYGNAANSSILEHLNIAEARVVVVAISNPGIVKNILLEVRKHNQTAYVVSSTYRLVHITKLFDAGASTVVSEQFETSVEILIRVLQKYLIPRNQIDDLIQRIRDINYQMERNIRYEQQGLQDYRLEISETEITTVKVLPGAPYCNLMLAEANFRVKYGINLLAIKRGGTVFSNPSGTEVLQQGDLLVVFGSHEDIDNFSRL